MNEKNKIKIGLVILCMLMLAIAFSMVSCSKSNNEEGKEQVAVEETEKGRVEINPIPQEQPEASQAAEEQQTETLPAEEESSEQPATGTEDISTARPSEVEFYLLFKRSSFVKRTIAEEQSRTYDLAGDESTGSSEGFTVTVTPLIITQDSVKFKINNYTTKALMEHESDGTSEFEIFVNNIYYRR
jgi:hypothetical protein